MYRFYHFRITPVNTFFQHSVNFLSLVSTALIPDRASRHPMLLIKSGHDTTIERQTRLIKLFIICHDKHRFFFEVSDHVSKSPSHMLGSPKSARSAKNKRNLTYKLIAPQIER